MAGACAPPSHFAGASPFAELQTVTVMQVICPFVLVSGLCFWKVSSWRHTGFVPTHRPTFSLSFRYVWCTPGTDQLSLCV